ncbi:MAG: hypothetical protein Q8Q28_09180 [Pseudomonadota bacterium]|nr:hypothetical protein [Pseudomonadota bacterium]
MKARKSMLWVLLLLLSTSVLAGGGKQRGDEGQGDVVQTQVRLVEPPAQWTASSTLPSAVPQSSATVQDDTQDDEFEELF